MKFTYIRLIFSTILFSLLFGCDNQGVETINPQQPAYLQVINLYSEADEIDMYFDLYNTSTLVVRDLDYETSWPATGYASLLTRDQDTVESDVKLRVIDENSEEVIPTESLKLIPRNYTTFCIVDSFGKPILVRTLDLLYETNANESFIRFMNLNSGVFSASIVDDDELVKIRGLNFLNYSSFRSIPSGTHSFEIRDEVTGAVLARIEDVEMLKGEVYSFILSNDGGAASASYYQLQ